MQLQTIVEVQIPVSKDPSKQILIVGWLTINRIGTRPHLCHG